MTAPLLETKFHLPRTHGRLVARPRVDALIDRATAATLTLVSAPAGFGKTTVMAELARHADRAHVAWLSLEPADNDPVTFWTYVVEALDRAAPGVGGAARTVIAGGPGSIDAGLTLLLNALTDVDAEVALVLDDFHSIDSTAVHERLAYVLEHLPSRAHVVIGTRADPAFPLARLRARGALVEIRASDLRFSPAEAASYLEAMGLSLTDGDVTALESRTEGWIAALQLAALSLQGRSDATEFIDAFAGDDRYIVDYLVEEVLRRQPDSIREFLLRTSVLARFSAPLADAVTGRDGGRETIEALDRGNLFLVALDDRRRWYRYHHLFGGVLQAHLATEHPGEIPALHRRASDWFEREGELGDAIEHAFRAGDIERAADLVERALPETSRLRRESTIIRWIGSLPDDVVERRPVLAVGYAGSILSLNERERVDELLAGAEQRLTDPTDRTVVDDVEFARLPAMIELYRGALAKIDGDLEGNIAHARRVLELVDEGDHLGRGGAAAFLGLAHWGKGELEEGLRWYREGMAELEKAGRITDLVGGAIVSADIRLAEGRVDDAQQAYEDGLALALRSQPPLRGVADMHTGLADIAYQRGHLDHAREHLEAGRRMGDESAFPRDPYRSRVVRARVLQAEGDVDGAIALLDEAERLYLSEYSPDVRPVAAVRARMQIAHDRLAAARAWADRVGLSTGDQVTYVREYEHTTLARLLVAETTGVADSEAPGPALDLLERLLAAAEAGRRDGSRLDILIVMALARHAAGDTPGALAALDAAVTLAEPMGYVRVFLDEGPAITRLLNVAAKRPHPRSFTEGLLRATGGGADRVPSRQGLVEPLSERELEVLRLLRSDLGGPAIANELVISLNTLRTHTKNIYAKLGVGSRRAAIRRAEELRLI